MMTKMFYLCNRFFVSSRNFSTEHVKTVKNSSFFCLNCQIPGVQVKWQPCIYNTDYLVLNVKYS